MKKITTCLFIISVFTFSLSAQSEHNCISKIERHVLRTNQDLTLTFYKVPNSEILKVKQYYKEENIHVLKKKKKLLKIEYYYKYGNSGGYESMNIYLQQNKPIFIESERKEIITAHLTNGSIEITEAFLKSKTFILDWAQNKFKYMNWNDQSNKFEYAENEAININFKSEKFNIIRILKLAETAIIEDSK